MTAPDMDGPADGMLAALRNASINAGDVQYVNAHGTSHAAGRQERTEAVKAAFGETTQRSSWSIPQIDDGHLLGAAGGIEAVFSSPRRAPSGPPPTINIFNQDPACDLITAPTPHAT